MWIFDHGCISGLAICVVGWGLQRLKNTTINIAGVYVSSTK
jgi:hypothetical protein